MINNLVDDDEDDKLAIKKKQETKTTSKTLDDTSNEIDTLKVKKKP